MKTKELSIICGIVMVAVFVLASMPVSADAAVLSAGQYKALYTTLNSGDTWSFSVQADDVDVMVMDDDNFQIYSNDGTPYVITPYSVNSVSQRSFTISGLTGKNLDCCRKQ